MNEMHGFLAVHVISALLSISGFIYRWRLALRHSAKLQQKWLRIAPHIIDTILLLSAIVLCILTKQYPFVQAWLTAKLLLLVVYIGLGTVAIKRAKNDQQRRRSGLVAIAVFVLIALIAIGHGIASH